LALYVFWPLCHDRTRAACSQPSIAKLNSISLRGNQPAMQEILFLEVESMRIHAEITLFVHAFRCASIALAPTAHSCKSRLKHALRIPDRLLQYMSLVALPPISHAGFTLIFTAVLKRCVVLWCVWALVIAV